MQAVKAEDRQDSKVCGHDADIERIHMVQV